MSIPTQFLDELCARLPVSEIASRRVKLVRKGREHMGLCPFHSERTPSFSVNDEKGFFYCFGCGAHGNVISFVMQTESLGFAEAVERLAAEAGLEMPRTAPADREAERRQAGLLDILESAARWFEQQLKSPEGREGSAYFARRGLSAETIARFRLGFAPGRGLMRQALLREGATDALLAEAGLTKQSESGPRDAFYDRVIFPIADRRGRVIAFGARALGDAKPKYLNSAETPVFHKGRVLYGFAQARAAATERRRIFVVEGYMDAITLAQGGIAEVVAPLGTALTEAQLELLWRVVDEPTLCFDGDAAGERAAFRAALRALPLLKPGKSLRFVALPKGEDPDSLVRQRGADAFLAAASASTALDEIVWRIETAGRSYDTPERRAALEGRANTRVAEIADRAVQEQYRQSFRRRLEVFFGVPERGRSFKSRSWVKGRRVQPAARSNAPFGFGSRPDPADALAHQDRIALALLINHPDLLAAEAERMAELTLSSPTLDRLLRALLNLAASNSGLDTAFLASHLNKHGFAELLGTVLDRSVLRLAPYAAAGADSALAGERLAEYLDMRQRAAGASAKFGQTQDFESGNSDRVA